MTEDDAIDDEDEWLASLMRNDESDALLAAMADDDEKLAAFVAEIEREGKEVLDAILNEGPMPTSRKKRVDKKVGSGFERFGSYVDSVVIDLR